MDDSSFHLTDMSTLLAASFPGAVGDFLGVLEAWKCVAGDQLAARCVPTKLRDGDLRVRCDSAAWVSELLHDQRELVGRLRLVQATASVERIVPYAGRVPGVRHSSDDTKPPAPTLQPLSASKIAEIDEMVVTISDPKTRESVRRAAIASAQRRVAGY